MTLPQLILLISGKRKSGKDFLSECLQQKLTPEKCHIVRISEPIKDQYAKIHDLNLDLLMGDSAYKETYRVDMINWSTKLRMEKYGYFCKLACENATPKNVWIVSDIRRKTDLKWFEENYSGIIKTVRVQTNIDVRKQRGWIFTPGVDDMASECDLDDVKSWDFIKDNNDTTQALIIIEVLYNFALQSIH